MTQDQTPSLRFPEFRGAWAVKPLSGVIKVITPPKKLPTKEYGETGSFPIIDQSKSQLSGWTDDKESIIDKGLPLIIFGDHTCVIKIAKDPFAQGADGIKIFGGSSDLTTEYLYQYLQFKPLESNEYRRHFSLLKEKKVFYPDKKTGEMQKITECLLSLDEVITVQGDRLDGLKDYKRGLMQQLFPTKGQTTPTHRFREFQGKDPWEAKKMGEIVTFKKGTGIAKNDITKDGINPCIRYGELFSDYGELINTVKSKTHRDIKEAVLSEDNDILMATSGFAPIALAKACALSQKGVIVGGDMLIIRSNQILNRFFAYYISANKEKVMRRAAGVTVYHVYKSDIASIEILLPPLAEQQRIADCLSSLDDLIAVQKQKIKTLKHHKNGLMQQLFPKL